MLEYEFETVSCDEGGGYSLFGGVGMETTRHRDIICRLAVCGLHPHAPAGRWLYRGDRPGL